jgi:hypothetical protein
MARQALEWNHVNPDKLPPKVKKLYLAFRAAEQALKDGFTADQKHKLVDGNAFVFSFRRGMAVAQGKPSSSDSEYDFS